MASGDAPGVDKLQRAASAQACASAQEAALAAELQRQTQEYMQEAARIKEVLDACGIHSDSMSARGRLAVALAAKVASALGCSEATPCHVLAAWASLLLRESEAAALRAKLVQAKAGLARDAAAADAQAEGLAADAREVAGQAAAAPAVIAEQQASAAHAATKDEGYQRSIDKLQRRLDGVGLTPELRHASLAAKAESAAGLQRQLADLQEQLARYQGLPTSTLGASMVLKQARQRLADLQEQLESGLAHL